MGSLSCSVRLVIAYEPILKHKKLELKLNILHILYYPVWNL